MAQEEQGGTSKKLGRYEVVYELGRGAMGTVFRGHDPQIDREVAVKTISLGAVSPADEAEFRERFFREARAAGKLTHSGIVAIYDAGVDEDTQTPYLVMEFVAGMTLEALAEGARPPVEKSLDLVKQVAEALDYAHSRQIVHRDIKPANIIVTGDGHAKITDFGIAKLQTQKFTQTGQVMGTPAYMSPEQLTAAPVDGRSDLFSLGTVLYWLLTGKTPFAGDTLATLTYKIVHTEPEPAYKANPDLSPDFDYVVQRALAKDPAQRYTTGRELADDIDDLMNGRSPRSRAGVAAVVPVPSAPAATVGASAPASLAATVVLPRERKRRWPWVAALALLLLLLGVGYWWWKAAPGETPVPAVATPAPATSAPAPTTQSTKPTQPAPSAPVVGWAAVQIRGTHNFDRATLYVYADSKQVGEFGLSGDRITGSLRLKTDTRTIGIRVRSSAVSSGWVPPGQRKKRRNLTFDQTRTISAHLKAGKTHTLMVDANRNRGLTLYWAD